MVNTPIPHSLKSEAKKAAKILKEFTVANAKAGPDKLIPGGILLKAKGLAILTVARLGFLVTARAGSGIVIAKLSDDLISAEWSAPAAIGMAGLGGGFEIGAEVTDFVIILNSRAAVEAFSKGGNLTLGGNFSIAAGPLGRNIEADVAVRSPAAIYTYSKTKGLFAGISIEGSGLIERKDANKKFYGRDIRAYQILSGEVDPPEDCAALYEVLEIHRERAQKAALNLAKKQALKHAHHAADKGKEKFHIPSFGFRSKEGKTSPKSSEVHKSQTTVRTMTKSHDNDVPSGGGRRGMVRRTVTTHTTRTVTHTGKAPAVLTDDVWEQMANKKAVALFPYKAHLPCDLTFDKGDEIEILQMTQTNQDWWEGKCHGKIGIFPANYVKVA